MTAEPERVDQAEEANGLVALALLSVIVGAAAGLLGAVFHLSLEQAARLRDELITWSFAGNGTGLLLVAFVCALAAAAAAGLVRWYAPHAAGSGIPHVEAVLHGELPQAPFRLIPVKFVGGLLAIGSGLALGREGPSVQMGASLAHLIGAIFHRSWADCRVLLAAGAGAGLASAFNTPIAGAVFVLEELLRRFDTRTTIATFGASAAAIAVTRVLLGDQPEFHVEPLPYALYADLPFYLVLGCLAGLLGIAYNATLLGTMDGFTRLRRVPREVRAAVVGAGVGALAWYAPHLVGGGDGLTQRALDGADPVDTLLVIFVLRFVLGAISYALRTPGGLFAPMLVLGSQGGVLFASLCTRWFPDFAPKPAALAIVGMTAFFTAVVRAPLTAITLVTEMTGSFTLLLPMLVACFTAMLVPTLLRNPPIYDSLRIGTLRLEKELTSETTPSPTPNRPRNRS